MKMNTCSVNACGILNIDNLEMQLKAGMDYETGAAFPSITPNFSKLSREGDKEKAIK